MKRLFIGVLFIANVIPWAICIETPRIVVMPFLAVGASEHEAVAAFNLFETALVQTNSFIVIEQNQA